MGGNSVKKEDPIYQAYVEILKKELVLAMGCTEPIAIAYASALARRHLIGDVEEVEIHASGNIIKNVKSVTVPNTNGKKGLKAAAAIGVVAGNSDLLLEVISHVNEEQLKELDVFLETKDIRVFHEKGNCALQIMIVLRNAEHEAKVKIQNEHVNVVYIEKDGEIIFKKEETYGSDDERYQLLQMKSIYEFAESVDIEDVREVLERQISCNMAIAQEGLKKGYGADIANVLIKTYGDSVQVRARAMAAAGSDARMSGCELPVVICSGSGNQGMSASLPVIVYAKEYNCSHEKLLRALVLSNLSTLYQKKFIGRLSAYCGAVSAGAGAGAGISYLLGGDYSRVCHTIVNTLAITSGILCDGAKPSCAAKIASAVDAGIMGCMMAKENKEFYCGEGIVNSNIEKTIEGVGHIARDGMKTTDDEIIKMMMDI